MQINCYACQNSFDCGASDNTKPCWCTKKPIVPINWKKKSCLCANCLDKKRQNAGALSCFRMWLSYNGKGFSGFQLQKNAKTVEGELKKALEKITQQKIMLTAAGRTDAGVHARGQAVSTSFFTRLSNRQLTLALASKLPSDISVWRIDSMPLNFDARRQSIGKQYVYRIIQGLVPDPFCASNSLHVRHSLDLDAMGEGAALLVGEHDFTSFRSALCSANHATRYIWHMGIKKTDALIKIDVRGNAFCLNMVRIIVGTLIDVGKGRLSPCDVEKILRSKNRTLAGQTAKAHGLTLEKVYYPDDLLQALIPCEARFPRYPVSSSTWGYANGDIGYGPT